LSGAETCVIYHSRGSHAAYHLARIRIQNIKLGRCLSRTQDVLVACGKYQAGHGCLSA
jgi:hypothetical protein